jgi:hypothetical protein
VSYTVERADGALIEGTILRPSTWCEDLRLTPGSRMRLLVDELQVDSFASITAIDPCPAIDDGPGQVVTGRFVTRQAGDLFDVTLADGTDFTGTETHPVWVLDDEPLGPFGEVPSPGRWVPLGELQPGDLLSTEHGPLAVAEIRPHFAVQDVYNLEIQTEHVYRITPSGVLVHNAGDGYRVDRIVKHHSWPKFLGGNPRQKVTDMTEETHIQLHRDLNNFLFQQRNELGQHMRPQRDNPGVDIRANFLEPQRIQALSNFYSRFQQTYPQAAADFFAQIR